MAVCTRKRKDYKTVELKYAGNTLWVYEKLYGHKFTGCLTIKDIIEIISNRNECLQEKEKKD